jgi:hypothetical protein
MARYFMILIAAIAAYAQGSTPKASAQDYPVHVKSGPNEIGAEYMVHSYSAGEQMFIAENYLVVEVAFFPPKGETVGVETSKFTLAVNGKKPIPVQNPSQVLAAIKHRENSRTRRVLSGLQLPGIGMGTGAPRTQPPFPGAPDPNRTPEPPRAPTGDSNTPTKETPDSEEILMNTALPEGPHKGPVSGFIYFPWSGKASTIKSLELDYEGVKISLR